MIGPPGGTPLDSSTFPTIIVVGPCASGKTTLARELAKSGIPVRICGQEHSSIRELWRTMNPDVLVALAIDLATLRARRHDRWPEHLFSVQQQRLASAFATADLVIDTSRVRPDQAALMVRRLLDRGFASSACPERPS